MSTNAQIRTTLEQQLREVSGLNVYRFPVDNVEPPCAVIANLETEPATFDDGRTVGVTVQVLASHNHVDQMERVDDLVDPNVALSIPNLISETTDLSLAVRSVGTIGLYEYAGVIYYGAPVIVEVID